MCGGMALFAPPPPMIPAENCGSPQLFVLPVIVSVDRVTSTAARCSLLVCTGDMMLTPSSVCVCVGKLMGRGGVDL